MTTVTLGHSAFTFIDQSGKSSVQRISSAVLTTGNIVAQTAAYNLLLAQTQLLSAGVLTKAIIGNLSTTIDPTPPTPPASRSNKFAVSYFDNVTGDKYTTQIPVANPSAVTFLSGTRLLDPAADPYMTWIGYFHSFALSEEGNAVTVTQARWVGRHI